MSSLPMHDCPMATFVMNAILSALAVLDAPLKSGMKMQSFSKFNLASRSCACELPLVPIDRNFDSNPAAMLQRV